MSNSMSRNASKSGVRRGFGWLPSLSLLESHSGPLETSLREACASLETAPLGVLDQPTHRSYLRLTRKDTFLSTCNTSIPAVTNSCFQPRQSTRLVSAASLICASLRTMSPLPSSHEVVACEVSIPPPGCPVVRRVISTSTVIVAYWAQATRPSSNLSTP